MLLSSYGPESELVVEYLEGISYRPRTETIAQ